MKAVHDYEPGGSLLPGRNYSSSTYNYGFNGMRKDDEIHGATGTSYDFGARLYDPRVGRWLSLDPMAKKYPNISPYAFSENNPIFFNDPTGKDAEVTIVGNTVTVTAVIKVYGSGATAAKASEIQASINGYWQATAHTYTDEKTGQVYNVKFNAVVQMYDPENPEAEPGFFSGRNNPASTDNFIRLTANQEEQDIYNKANGITTHAGDEYVPGFVKGGDEGVWRADVTGSNTWAHEFGHLLGEKDRSHRVFIGESVPGDHKAMQADRGYEFNIMSYSPWTTEVEQANVDYLIKPVVDKYNASDKPSSTGCCSVQTPVYKDKIDP